MITTKARRIIEIYTKLNELALDESETQLPQEIYEAWGLLGEIKLINLMKGGRYGKIKVESLDLSEGPPDPED